MSVVAINKISAEKVLEMQQEVIKDGYYTALDEAKSRIAAKLKEMGVE